MLDIFYHNAIPDVQPTCQSTKGNIYSVPVQPQFCRETEKAK